MDLKFSPIDVLASNLEKACAYYETASEHPKILTPP